MWLYSGTHSGGRVTGGQTVAGSSVGEPPASNVLGNADDDDVADADAEATDVVAADADAVDDDAAAADVLGTGCREAIGTMLETPPNIDDSFRDMVLMPSLMWLLANATAPAPGPVRNDVADVVVLGTGTENRPDCGGGCSFSGCCCFCCGGGNWTADPVATGATGSRDAGTAGVPVRYDSTDDWERTCGITRDDDVAPSAAATLVGRPARSSSALSTSSERSTEELALMHRSSSSCLILVACDD